ncbi:MAG TPA: molybdopterin-dependent oxidoreductase [Polyangia bacterium]|jgi:anaerobic selenocysteine-containing dehydrogenase
MAQTRTFCGLCDAGCGLVVEHDGAEVRAIRGDRDDPQSRGHICPKALAHADLARDPDRLRQPLRRRGASWEPVTWDAALDEIAGRLTGIQERHGGDAVALYYGNPVAHAYGTLLVLLPFIRALGTRNVYSANSLDARPRMLVSRLLYGNEALLPVPDLGRTRFLLAVGANPVVSNGSVMTAPDCARRVGEVRGRGGRLVVVDPRRTETAAIADTHLFVRPGADALLLAAMLHVLFAEGLVRLGDLDGLVAGLAELEGLVRPFPPEQVAAATGVAADDVRGLARDFAAAPAAAAYGRMGACTQEHASLTTWLLDALTLVTGNLDRPGGLMFASPAVDLVALASGLPRDHRTGRWRSRVAGLPEIDGELPVAALADEIETPGPGQVRALVMLAGNPVLAAPDGRRLDRALAGLELMVAVDLYLNETTRHAHLVLPAAAPLECDRYPLLEAAMAVGNHARHTRAVLPRPPGVREDWDTLVALADRLGRRRGGLAGHATRLACAAARAVGPARALDLLLRAGPHHLSLAQVEAAPHGLDLGPLRPRLAGLLRRTGRRLPLVPAPLGAELARLATMPEVARGGDELRLITRRLLRSMNTWLHNCPRLVRGPDQCTLRMHPDDAAARGLAAGQRVRVASAVGAIEVPLELGAEMMPGVVSLPFGFGHDRPGARLTAAGVHPGASMNDLLDARWVDAVSGTSVLGGTAVRVTAA